LFKDVLQKTANRIKSECGVKDWQTATEDKLKLRDKIHENISLLSDVLHDIDQVIDISIKKAKEETADTQQGPSWPRLSVPRGTE